jgi:hypothetical protein
MIVKASGTFNAFDSKIFRSDSYIQWGDSSKTIGLVIMLNPGSSRLANNTDWDTFIHRCERGEEFSQSGDLEMDPTMNSIHHILSTSNPELEGVLHIYNLFNYRWGKSNEAIRTYSWLLQDSRYHSYLHSPLPPLESFPWIWTAWSVESGASINSRKKHIIKKLSGTNRIALYSSQKDHQTRKELFCYHPCPQQKAKREWVQSEMIKEFKKYYLLDN